MSKKPLVSVIMNCYNSDTYLKEAIDSIITQTYTNWEIIFWDNQSTDNSANIVKSYNNERIKYFYAPTHTTLGEGRNKALEQSKGELISFLDCDDIIANEKIELQVKEFLIDESVGFIYSNGARIDKNGQIKTPFYRRKSKPSGFILKDTLKSYDIYIPSVMFKKNIVIDNKIIFNKNYKYIEEYDFFLRILYFTKAKYIHEKVSFWRVHENSTTWNNYENFIDEREDFIDNFFIGDMKKVYKDEILSIKELNLFQQSLVLWKKNDSAIEIIKPLRFKKLKYFLLYLLMHIRYEKVYPLIIKFKYMK